MDTKGVRLDKDDQRRLKAIVEETDADESVVMRKLLRRGLDHHEANGGDTAVPDGGTPPTSLLASITQDGTRLFAGISGALVFIQYTSELNLIQYATYSFSLAFIFAILYHANPYLPPQLTGATDSGGDTA